MALDIIKRGFTRVFSGKGPKYPPQKLIGGVKRYDNDKILVAMHPTPPGGVAREAIALQRSGVLSLEKADFSGLNALTPNCIQGMRGADVRFDGTVFSSMAWRDESTMIYDTEPFSNLELPGVSFRGAFFSLGGEIVFESCEMNDANFENAIFEASQEGPMRNIVLFLKSSLDGAKFGHYAGPRRLCFERTSLKAVDFTGVEKDIEIDDCDIEGARFAIGKTAKVTIKNAANPPQEVVLVKENGVEVAAIVTNEGFRTLEGKTPEEEAKPPKPRHNPAHDLIR